MLTFRANKHYFWGTTLFFIRGGKLFYKKVYSLHHTPLKIYSLHHTPLKIYSLHYTPLKIYSLHYTPLKIYSLQYTSLKIYSLHYSPLKIYSLHYTSLKIQFTLRTPENYFTRKYSLHYTPLKIILQENIQFTLYTPEKMHKIETKTSEKIVQEEGHTTNLDQIKIYRSRID